MVILRQLFYNCFIALCCTFLVKYWGIWLIQFQWKSNNNNGINKCKYKHKHDIILVVHRLQNFLVFLVNQTVPVKVHDKETLKISRRGRCSFHLCKPGFKMDLKYNTMHRKLGVYVYSQCSLQKFRCDLHGAHNTCILSPVIKCHSSNTILKLYLKTVFCVFCQKSANCVSVALLRVL